MRRLSTILLAVLGAGAALLLLVPDPGALRHASPEVISRGWMRVLSGGPLAAMSILGSPASAWAEEVLEFKPVPAESLGKLDRARRRTVRRIEAPELPPAIEAPDAPPAPALPAAPSSDARLNKTGNIMRIGSDVHVGRDQVVTGDLLAVGGDVTVEGHVEGDVVAMGGDVQLAATARVDGDVASIGGELSEEDGAFVGGQRVTAKGMRDYGKLRRHADRVDGEESHGWFSRARASAAFAWLLVFLAAAWGFTSLVPKRSAAAFETIQREPGVSIGVGLVVWALLIPSVVALALVVAVLCITIIGIPLGVAAAVGYVLLLALLWFWGLIVACAALGDLVAKRMAKAPAGVSVAGLDPPAAPGTTVMSLTRKAVLGVLVLGGLRVVGELFKGLGFSSPLHVLGSFLVILAKLGVVVAATLGAGALVRAELAAGTLGRWWHGRRGGSSAFGSTRSTASPAGVPSGTTGAYSAPSTVEPAGYPPPPAVDPGLGSALPPETPPPPA